MQKIDDALFWYEEALHLLDKMNVENQPINIALENCIGYCNLKAGNTMGAETDFSTALASNRYSEVSDVDSVILLSEFISSKVGLIKVNYQKYLKSGNESYYEKCLLLSEQCISAMQQKINNTISYDVKSFFKDRFRAVFEESLDINSNRDRHQEFNEEVFFDLLEQSKQSILSNEISAYLNLFESDVPDSMLRKEVALNEKIKTIEQKQLMMIENGVSELDSSMLSLSVMLFRLKEEQKKLLDLFEKKYPSYYRLKFELKTIGLKEIQKKMLNDKQSLLEFFVGEEAIFAIMVNKDTCVIKKLGGSSMLESWVQQLRNGITGYYKLPIKKRTDEKYKDSLTEFISASQYLYDLLIRPFEKILKNEIIIVADGNLNLIPFGTLLSDAPAVVNNFNSYPFLEKDRVISYCFSASELYKIAENPTNRNNMKSIAAFAPFNKNGYDILDNNYIQNIDYLTAELDSLMKYNIVTRSGFSELPYSGEEASYVTSLFDGDVFLDKEATVYTFLGAIGQYRILHLSTHGEANATNGGYSYVVFAESEKANENRILYAKDIYNKKINAEMVVLSACETGNGEMKNSEGVISLAKAFVFAGAKSVITTLWAVEDKSTKDLMSNFYQYLKNGNKKNEALQNAKKDFLTNKSNNLKHPFFWAGFVPVGDMSAME